MVEEAGGVATDFKGENQMLQNGEVIAAPEGIHDAVATHLRAIFET